LTRGGHEVRRTVPLPRPRPRPLPARSSRRGENSIALRRVGERTAGGPFSGPSSTTAWGKGEFDCAPASEGSRSLRAKPVGARHLSPAQFAGERPGEGGLADAVRNPSARLGLRRINNPSTPKAAGARRTPGVSRVNLPPAGHDVHGPAGSRRTACGGWGGGCSPLPPPRRRPAESCLLRHTVAENPCDCGPAALSLEIPGRRRAPGGLHPRFIQLHVQTGGDPWQLATGITFRCMR
jgi:hypothetical protein